MKAAPARTRAVVATAVGALTVLLLVATCTLPSGTRAEAQVTTPTDPTTASIPPTTPPPTEPPPTQPVETTESTTTIVPPVTYYATTTTTYPAVSMTFPPTTLPGQTTTTISVPPLPGTNPTGDPAAAGDAPSEAVPQTNYVVPPLPGSPILPNGFGPSHVILGALNNAKDELNRAKLAHDTAVTEVAQVRQKLERASAAQPKLSRTQSRQVDRVAGLQKAVINRMVDAYIGAHDGGGVGVLLGSVDATDYSTRQTYAASVVDALRSNIADLHKARRTTSPKLVKLAETRASLQIELVAAVAIEAQTKSALDTAGVAVQAFAAGSSIFVTGFVFPEGDPHNFVDSFGAPRLVGTADFHYHEGVDLMAPAGTPEFACERGVILKVSSSKLGGNGFWLKGQSGTAYYYAHLESYAPGMTPGRVIDAGTTIGYVGSTGDAQASAPHLHFEIHPNGGPAVDPYPMLHIIDEINHGRNPQVPG